MEEFLVALSSLNFTIPNITLDGKIHRFSRDGKDNGWYIGWQNYYIKSGEPYVVCKFGDWKTGEDHLYKPTGAKLTKDDAKAIREQLDDSVQRQAAEKELAQKEAAIAAEKVWETVRKLPQGSSPYLERKKIKLPAAVLTNQDNVLFIPMHDVTGKFWGFQRILPDKDETGRDKKFFYRQRVSGCFFLIGKSLDETNEVMLCEGFATGCTVHQVTQITTIVAFDAGNLKAVAKDIHAKHPSLVITVCADDDRFTESGNTGVTKATQAAELCNGILKVPQFNKDDHRGTDFNDLYCLEGEAACRAQFAVKEEPSAGFYPLGYVGHEYYFYSVSQKDIVCITTFSSTQLYALAPASYWYGNYPSKTGTAWEQVKDFLVNISRAVGRFDAFRIRGTGVWNDRCRVVVNTGNSLIVDGQSMSTTNLKSRYIYICTKASMPEIHKSPLTVAECSLLIDACNLLLWENPKSGPLLAGWLATARISGALPIRPHVWITGGAGVGKSTIMEHLVANALGDPSAKIYAQGGSTEAGIRQTMKGSAMPIIFDEFETTDEKSTGNRVASIIEMFRQAWSESQGVILKGSASGKSDMYSINFSALVSSIRPALVNDADKSRFSLLELTPHKSDPNQWVMLNKILDKITQEYGERLFARMVGMTKQIAESARIISNELAIVMGKRYGQQNGMLLAGFWALNSDHPIDQVTARNMVGELEIQHEKDDMTPDHVSCAFHLLTSKVNISGSSGEHFNMSIEQILRSNRNDHKEMLASEGIYIGDDNHIVVSSKHVGIQKIYQGTKWVHNWLITLGRLDHANVGRFRVKFDKLRIRGIKIDYEELLKQ